MKDHKHNYYKNESGRMECAQCGLLKSTIIETPLTEAKECENCKSGLICFKCNEICYPKSFIATQKQLSFEEE